MISGSAALLDSFFASFPSASRPLLLLDYDGTLAPFRLNRFEATPWPGARGVLNRIQAQGRTRIALITGRPPHEIAPLLALDAPVEVWGLHGFERLLPDGHSEREPIPAAAQRKLDELEAALTHDAFGGLYEHKPNAAVMHWRGLGPEQAGEVRRRSYALFEPALQIAGFRLLPFEAGVELRIGRDKGGAIEALLAECGGCGPAAFLGDDLTDEPGFRAVKGRGLSALVRPEWRETAADVWLKPPEELLMLLERWREAAA